MFSLEMECAGEHQEAHDLLIAELWEQGSAGVVESDARHLRAFFADTADRDELLRRFPAARLRIEEDRDWVQTARDLMQPLLVGSRFFLVPEWRDDPAPPGRFRIAVNPGMAFGTGIHETTQLCLEALEEFVAPGMTVLDVGTGSGILVDAARLLGAARVYGCDVDPVAVEIGRGAFAGSVDAVASGVADLVVANINPGTVVRIASDLVRALRSPGVLLASGLELDDLTEVLERLPAPRDIRRKGNWALIVCAR